MAHEPAQTGQRGTHETGGRDRHPVEDVPAIDRPPPRAVGSGLLKLAIVERDGVINEALRDGVRSIQDWRPILGSLDAIARLGRAGYRIVVATNQPGIRRRHLTFEDLNRIHEQMHRRLAEYGGTVDAVFTCLCLPRKQCECFSPHPSVLHEIAERLHVSLRGVPCFGATAPILDAAVAAGARPIGIRAGNERTTGSTGAFPQGIEIDDDLASAVDALLAVH